jgi:hypothetical protein
VPRAVGVGGGGAAGCPLPVRRKDLWGLGCRHASLPCPRLLPHRAAAPPCAARSELQDHCCAILSSLVSRALAQPPAGDLAPLGALLPALLSTLGQGLEAQHAAGAAPDTPAARAMLELVEQLTTGAPQGLRPFLRQASPAPALHALAAAPPSDRALPRHNASLGHVQHRRLCCCPPRRWTPSPTASLPCSQPRHWWRQHEGMSHPPST